MSVKKLLAIAIASLVLIGGAAAVGAAAPVDQAHENATADIDEDETKTNEELPENATHEQSADEPDETAPHASGDANDNASAATDVSDRVGPADGLPAVVPDHVSTLHETIEAFLGGSVETLGDALSELLGSDAGSEPIENSTTVDRP